MHAGVIQCHDTLCKNEWVASFVVKLIAWVSITIAVRLLNCLIMTLEE